jgi:formylmethanofuran dehydrogenase subunit E
MIIGNPSICIECGKQRIVVATHEEKVGNSVVVYKETICPDPECQKKVEKILAKELEKRQQSAMNQKLRIEGRKMAKLREVRSA